MTPWESSIEEKEFLRGNSEFIVSACPLQPQSTLQLSSHLVNYVRAGPFKWNTGKGEECIW